MKKILHSSVLVIIVLLMTATSAFALGKGNVKGEVLSIDADTFTVENVQEDLYIVYPPTDFDMGSLAEGDSVLVKGTANEDGSISAEFIVTPSTKKNNGKGKPDNPGEGKPEDFTEGKLDHSAYCDPEKTPDNTHGLISGIAKKFEITQEEVQAYFCDGYSLGAIMLAMKTSELGGGTIGDLLAGRADGQSWGWLWQESNLIGNEADGKSPPGWLNRPEHAGQLGGD